MSSSTAHRAKEEWEDAHRADDALQPTRVISLSSRSTIQIYENALRIAPSEFKEFWEMKPNEQLPGVFGHLTPREQTFYAEPNVPGYRFSVTPLQAKHEFPSVVQKCIEFSKRAFPGVRFNGALVNWYKDGSMSISAHSDDERDMEQGKPICSFSFGATRTFRVTPKDKNDKRKWDIPTLDASCIVMMGDMQKEFLHEVPKTKMPVGPRINVTVRAFHPVDQRPTKKAKPVRSSRASSSSSSSSSSDSDEEEPMSGTKRVATTQSNENRRMVHADLVRVKHYPPVLVGIPEDTYREMATTMQLGTALGPSDFMFTLLPEWAGKEIPADAPIDQFDQAVWEKYKGCVARYGDAANSYDLAIEFPSRENLVRHIQGYFARLKHRGELVNKLA